MNLLELWDLSLALAGISLVIMLVLIVALGVLWRSVVYALGMPIWGDEAFLAINFVVRDFGELVDPLVYGQIAPLAFVWAELAVSRALGWSEWALRLIPFLAGVTCLLLFARFCVQVLPRRAALLSIGIFAASYYVVRHGAEVKPYSTDALISQVAPLGEQARFAAYAQARIAEGYTLPLRESPRSTAAVRGQPAGPGQELTVMGVRGDWLRVFSPEVGEGWMRWYYDGAQYIELANP